MEDYSMFVCPWISKEDIWNIADDFRSKYWSENSLPVDIESIIEKQLKLDIDLKRGLLSDLDIDAFLKRDLTGIAVDYDCWMDERFSNRLRFSYAHEIGHLELHKDIYIQIPISTSEEWKKFMKDIPDREYGYFEYQANEFAGRLLVPRARLKLELENCIKLIENAGMYEFLQKDPGAILSRISPTLCRPFGVSYAGFLPLRSDFFLLCNIKADAANAKYISIIVD